MGIAGHEQSYDQPVASHEMRPRLLCISRMASRLRRSEYLSISEVPDAKLVLGGHCRDAALSPG